MFQRCILLAAFGALPQLVFASCGSAFCAVNTGAEAQGLWSQPGTRIDLRYEYVKQDEVRSGTTKVGPAGEPGEHDELSTLNRNWRLAIDHNFDARWGVSLVVPYVGRDHEHLHNAPADEQPADPELESWRIREVGDVQVVGRYQFLADEASGRAVGVRVGLKLPTGRHEVRNENGEAAERTLQPGTGTTDAIVGAYYRGPLIGHSDWFAAATLQSALNTRDDFRPGTRLGVDLGISVPLAVGLSGQLQLNLLERGRDAGGQADRQDSGGTLAYLSPGLALALSQRWTVYAFAQVPLYQYVNGRQLTAGTGGVVGASVMF